MLSGLNYTFSKFAWDPVTDGQERPSYAYRGRLTATMPAAVVMVKCLAFLMLGTGSER